ncbi:hypothetical protein BKA65DRAFT_570240 [Rhexocercosporidium sp. MPI-PUGE-AT-0058]|nr:hypothetical protein BKA65DRAFT_570240 [Rhexocercosporidium sp. MPI-PUGE-AT-0058]
MTATNLLYPPIPFLSAAEGYRQPVADTRRGVRWLEQGRTVLVRLDTPDLPLWDAYDQVTDITPSLIFNFTLQDKRILLLNGVPVFPLQNAYVPPRLYARQSTISLTEFEHGQPSNFDEGPLHAIDYHRVVPISEHPSAHYNVFTTQLELDVLGAEFAGQHTLLRDKTQPLILVYLNELPPFQKYPYYKSIAELDLTLSDSLLRDRFPYNTPFSAPKDLAECTLWSWRCSDIDEYPWYRYIYRESFDEHGKIGSFRHMLLQIWERFGFWQATMMLAVGMALLLAPLFWRLHRAAVRTKQHVKGLYTRREEHELHKTDAEAACLLDYEDSEEAGHDENDLDSNAELNGDAYGRHPTGGQDDFGKPSMASNMMAIQESLGTIPS